MGLYSIPILFFLKRAASIPLGSSLRIARRRRWPWLLAAGSLVLLKAAGTLGGGAWLREDRPDPRWVTGPSTNRDYDEEIPAARPLGEAALECSLHDLAGQTVNLKAFVGQMPVVIEFGSFT
jgi:hypothetical protein